MERPDDDWSTWSDDADELFARDARITGFGCVLAIVAIVVLLAAVVVAVLILGHALVHALNNQE